MRIHTLIVCPGHGVNINPSVPHVHASWCGLYKYPEEPILLVEHIKVAVAMAAAQNNSLLVFSGGNTSSDAGDRSEARSYMDIASHAGWWGAPEVANRSQLDEDSRDSRDNIVYSLAEFKRLLGVFPNRVVVCGFAFKAERYLMHMRANGWCREFMYMKINNPPVSNGVLKAALDGEEQKRLALVSDPHLLGYKWVRQREERNPFCRSESYSEDVPDLAPFLKFLKGKSGYVKPPWNMENA